MNLRPTLSEEQGLNSAFGFGGRKLSSSFTELRARSDNSESSSFANPLGPDYGRCYVRTQHRPRRQQSPTRLARLCGSRPENGTKFYSTLTPASFCFVTTFICLKRKARFTPRARQRRTPTRFIRRRHHHQHGGRLDGNFDRNYRQQRRGLPRYNANNAPGQ